MTGRRTESDVTMSADDELLLSDLSAAGDPSWRSFSDRVIGEGKMKAKSRKRKGTQQLQQAVQLSALSSQLSPAYGRRFLADVAVARVALYR